MRITVFGASGKVGRLVVALALRRGHDVVAVLHEHDIFERTSNLTVKKANVYSAGEVAEVLGGSDAVISCLGSWGTPKRNVLSAAMQAIIPAMEQQKIARIITLTGSGAADPQQKPSPVHRLIMGALLPLPAGKVFADGEQHMRLLVASDLAWTTIRSPIMSGHRASGYRLSMRPGIHFIRISRQTVARALLDQLERQDFIRQAPVIRPAKATTFVML